MAKETSRKGIYKKRYLRMFDDSDTYRAVWKDIAKFVNPKVLKFLEEPDDPASDGRRRDENIINGSAKDAIKIVAAGLQGGLTSPSRPWFNTAIPDDELMKFTPVREWLYMVRNRLLGILAGSNFYGAVHGLYGELATFGTSTMLIEESFRSVIRCRPFTIGEVLLGTDEEYRISTMYRRFKMSADQMITKFGEENVSEKVLETIEKNQPDDKFEVQHVIERNTQYNPHRKDFASKKFIEVYFEVSGDQESDTFLSEQGYDIQPFVSPRWSVSGVNTYGDGPCEDNMGDIKMLQSLEEKKLAKLDYHLRPVVNAPYDMQNQGGNMLPAGMNFYNPNSAAGANGITPAYQVDANIQSVAYEIGVVVDRIRKGFFNDLFLTIINSDKTQTATEVARKHEEKLMLLGPVIEKAEEELLDGAIARVFQIADSLGLFPERPPELNGVNIQAIYTSLLHQAQKMVAITPIEQTVAFVANLSAVYPTVTDKIDADEAVDQYAEAIGVQPKIVKSDDKVQAIREQRARDEAVKEQQAQMVQAAESAKVMSETDMGENNALEAMLGQ